MAVRAQEGVTRNPKSFQVNLVTDSVAGSGKDSAVLGCKGLQKSVVIAVLKSGLEGIVVHIADREFGGNPRHLKCFKLKTGHGACGILCKGLVNRKLYGLTRPRRRAYAVRLQDPFKKVFA